VDELKGGVIEAAFVEFFVGVVLFGDDYAVLDVLALEEGVEIEEEVFEIGLATQKGNDYYCELVLGGDKVLNVGAEVGNCVNDLGDFPEQGIK